MEDINFILYIILGSLVGWILAMLTIMYIEYRKDKKNGYR